ncbi:MAG: mechanosensitive ion channel family protein [Acidiferrobacter sp.]
MGIVSQVEASAQDVLYRVAHWAPRLAAALLIVIAGWLFARVLRVAARKGLRLINFQVLAQRAGLDALLSQGGIEVDTVAVLAFLIYWLAIIATLVIACDALGLPYVTNLLAVAALFVPRIIVAVLILALGLYFARFVGQALTVYMHNIGLEDGEILGRFAQYGIAIFVGLFALAEMDVARSIIRDAFLIVLSGIMLAFALAFGLGGRRWAAGILERQWPRRDSAALGSRGNKTMNSEGQPGSTRKL